jgi:hypothetical protein
LPSPIELYVTYEPHRFITRFNAIQQEVQAQLREMSDEAEAEAESAAVIGVEAEMGEEETYDHPEEVDGSADADEVEEGNEDTEHGGEQSQLEPESRRDQHERRKEALQGDGELCLLWRKLNAC